MNSPVATTALLPNLRTHRVDIGAKIISTTDCGRNTAPGFDGRVAEHLLRVLRQQEDRAEQREERRA